MPSDHTGDPATFNETISFPTDGDPKHITPIRSGLDLLLDNDAHLRSLRSQSDVESGALRIFPLALSSGTVTDATGFMAAAQEDPTDPTGLILLIKSDDGDTFGIRSGAPYTQATGADIDSDGGITSAVREAAGGAGRVVVIGTGGTRNAYSLTGSAWVAGAAGIGGAVEFIAWSPANALTGGGEFFICGGSGTGSVYQSPDAATGWTSEASGFSAVLGIAVLGGDSAFAGWHVLLGNIGVTPQFAFSSDNGAAYTLGAQPPNFATAEEPGSIAGAPESPVGDKIYHVMRCNGGARLRTSYSQNATTWEAGSTIEGSEYGLTFSAGTRLLICPTTGLFVIVATVGSSVVALFASRDFVTWSGPTILDFSSTAAFAVAGGRVFCTRLGNFFASPGVR